MTYSEQFTIDTNETILENHADIIVETICEKRVEAAKLAAKLYLVCEELDDISGAAIHDHTDLPDYMSDWHGYAVIVSELATIDKLNMNTEDEKKEVLEWL